MAAYYEKGKEDTEEEEKSEPEAMVTIKKRRSSK